MGLYLVAARKLNWWSECLAKLQAMNQAPNTPLKLLVSMPSLFQAHLSMGECHGFSLAVNNAG